ncbi:MAG TPA: hypothetical protein VE029_01250, partial [Rhizobacter sp.]|nr:hypothetical protein [Rhizobacter sp.]
MRRALAWAGVAIGVLVLHGGVLRWLAWQAASFDAANPMPARIQVAYVREMALENPAPARRATRVGVSQRARRTQAAAVAQPVEAPASQAQATAAEPRLSSAEADAEAVTAPATEASAAVAAAAAPFEWPVSTRLRYVLTGNYRGEVSGQAQVEWIRVGMQYQLHLDVTVGMAIAPLLFRRMSSSGAITPDGLAPQRYDQETKLVFQDRQRAT